MRKIALQIMLVFCTTAFASAEDCRTAVEARTLTPSIFDEIREKCEQQANSGNAEVAYALYQGTILQGLNDTNLRKESRKWLKISAISGNEEAQNTMGELYENGDPETGVLKNNNEALKWFKKAAISGQKDSQFRLGMIYLNGIGVIKDYTVALNWFRKSALNNNYTAQYNLAAMYYHGTGMKPDLVKAYTWASIAAANISSRVGFEKDAFDDYYSLRDEIESNLTNEQLKKSQELTSSVSTILKKEKCFMQDNVCILLP